MSENIKITQALIQLQGSLKNVPMDSVNPHFKNKYASLLAVRDAIQKPLADNKLSITQTFAVGEKGLTLITTLRHESGETITSEFPVSGTTPQQQGSASTYARRYSLLAMLNLVGDPDDDGNAAEAPAPARSTQRGQRPAIGGTKQKSTVEIAEGIATTLGYDALNDWYKSITPAELKDFDPHKSRILKLAKDFDAEREHVQGIPDR